LVYRNPDLLACLHLKFPALYMSFPQPLRIHSQLGKYLRPHFPSQNPITALTVMANLPGRATSNSCFVQQNMCTSVIPFPSESVPAVFKETLSFWLPVTILNAEHPLPPTYNSRYFKISFIF